MAERIGFIGLGAMGAPMAQNLLKAGFSLTVWNRTASRAGPLVAAGAQTVQSPEDLARVSDIVITIVSDTAAVEDVVFGEKGIVAGAHEGLVVVDMSTISPVATKHFASRLHKRAVDMLDAPVSGGDAGARAGTLTIMVGGEERVFRRCLPVFEAMGQRVTLCGDHGAGQTVKLVNQIIVVETLLAVSEGLLFASAAGVDLDKMYSAISAGSASSWALLNRGNLMLKREWKSGFTARLQYKDVRLALEAAQALDLPLPTLALAGQYYAALMAAGLSEEGNHAVARALEALSGRQIGRKK